jgi:hypothetical protein
MLLHVPPINELNIISVTDLTQINYFKIIFTRFDTIECLFFKNACFGLISPFSSPTLMRASWNVTSRHQYLKSIILRQCKFQPSGPRQVSRYSDSLHAGRSRDRIPLGRGGGGGGRHFPYPSRPVLGPTKPPMQWAPVRLFGGKAAGAWCWPPLPSIAEVKEWVQLYLCCRVNFTFNLNSGQSSNIIINWYSLVTQSVLRQVHSLFKSLFSTQCDLVPPLANSSNFSLP